MPMFKDYIYIYINTDIFFEDLRFYDSLEN